MLISLPRLGSFAISLVLVVACYLVITRTKLGRGLRSIAESSTVSEMLGVDVGRTVSGMYLISGVLAGMGRRAFRHQLSSGVLGYGFGGRAQGHLRNGPRRHGQHLGALLGALIIAVVEVLTISSSVRKP